MSKKSIKLGRTVDTVVTYIILIVVAFIFFFPCLWLILASFSESGSIYSFQGFFPSASVSEVLSRCLRIPPCTIIPTGSKTPCSSP